jgi:hypothetical protein
MSFTQDYDAKALQAALAMGDGLMRTMCIARLLMANGRTVDMTGLDRGMGLFCAKALDLAPELGRSLRASLVALLAEVDAFTAALRAGEDQQPVG